MTTHGCATSGKQTTEYVRWTNMKCRCGNKNHKQFSHYGGRGITICEQWINSFPTFLADMGLCPSGMQLERVNNNEGYNPTNCKWATHAENNRNKRNNIMVTIKGETKCVSDWCKIFNVTRTAVQHRIKKGWDKDKWFIPIRSMKLRGNAN